MTGILLRALLALAALTLPHATASEAEPRWEINLDMSAERNDDGLLLSTPEAEAIYQWNERLHLTAASGWLHVHPSDERAVHGLGAGTVGFKWLLAGHGPGQWSVAFWPQYTTNFTSSSVRDGLASPHRAIALPLEIKFTAPGFDVELIAGPNFSRDGNTWDTELKLIHACLPRTDCTLVVERSFTRDEPALTRLVAGAEWRLTEGMIVKTGLGRDIGPARPGRSEMALALGLKLLY